MDKGILSVLVVVIITLLAVLYSHFDLKSEIAIGNAIQDANEPVAQAAGGISIVVRGVGASVTSTSGSGNCNLMNQIVAEASISGGGAGNKIKVEAICSLGNFTASAEPMDPGIGSGADYDSGIANPGRGAASCTTSYTSAAAPDSTWLAVCTF